MKQPPIKYNRDCFSWSELDTDKMQLANHWNIANGHARKLQTLINRLWLDGVIDRETSEALKYECDNACVGIHNLGQQLVKVEDFDYDFTKIEGLGTWEDPNKSIYAHPIKKMRIVGK